MNYICVSMFISFIYPLTKNSKIEFGNCGRQLNFAVIFKLTAINIKNILSTFCQSFVNFVRPIDSFDQALCSSFVPYLLQPTRAVNERKTLVDTIYFNFLEYNTASEIAECFQNLGWDFLKNLYEGICFKLSFRPLFWMYFSRDSTIDSTVKSTEQFTNGILLF